MICPWTPTELGVPCLQLIVAFPDENLGQEETCDEVGRGVRVREPDWGSWLAHRSRGLGDPRWR